MNEATEQANPVIRGTNHIRLVNTGDASINRIYIRNSSNYFFNDNDPESPRTHVRKIEGSRVGVVPAYTSAIMMIGLAKDLNPGDETVIHVTFETVFSGKSGKEFSTVGSVEDTTVYVLKSFYPQIDYLYPDDWGKAKSSKEKTVVEHLPAADFLIEISVPENYKMASSGVLLNKNDESGRVIYKYAGNNLREFAAVTSKYYEQEIIRVPGMAATLLMTPGQLRSVHRLKPDIRDMLNFYSRQFGSPDSPELTISSSYSLGTDLTGYPNLFILTPGSPAYEKAVAHELAHQWFGSKGTYEYPDDYWFVEAVAEYAAGLYFRSKQKNARRLNRNLPAFDYSLKDLMTDMTDKSFVEWVQLAYEISGDNSLPPFYEPEKKKWEHVVDRYSVFSIGSYCLQMLEETIGQNSLNASLVAFSRTETGTPLSAERFLEHVEEFSDAEIARQFALAITTAAKADLIIKNVISEVGPDGRWDNRIVIGHTGKWLFPVDVRCTTTGGEILFRKDIRFAFQDTLQVFTDAPLKKVEIDPDNKIFDSNRYNNRWPRTFAPQPLTEIPSWKVYSIYFYPRALSAWDGGQRFGVRYSGRLGINLMPYQSALYQHAFDLDILFATSRSERNWAWNLNYRTPVRSTDLMFWRLSMGYDYPRNTQGLSFVFYLGRPLYWAVDGRSAYKRLTTNISRMEYTESDSTNWWRKSQSWTVKQKFVWFNYSGGERYILRGSVMSGVYVRSGEKYRISKISSAFDYERHYDIGLIFRTHLDGGLAYGVYQDNSFKFRIRRVSGGWKTRESYIPLFRGAAEGDRKWHNSVMSAGVSLGIETNWYIWPMVYSDMVITGGNEIYGDIGEQVTQLFNAGNRYTAFGFGVESQSIIELGVYFPLWISHPPGNESNFEFRLYAHAGFYF